MGIKNIPVQSFLCSFQLICFYSPFLIPKLMQEPFCLSLQQGTFPAFTSTKIVTHEDSRFPSNRSLSMLKDLTWVIFFTSFSTTRSTGISILPTQTFSINVNFFEKLLSLSLSIHHFTQVHLLAVIRIRIIFFTKKNCDTIKMTSKPQWTIKYLKGKSDKNLKP